MRGRILDQSVNVYFLEVSKSSELIAKSGTVDTASSSELWGPPFKPSSCLLALSAPALFSAKYKSFFFLFIASLVLMLEIY